jgi:AcrR family transcriptional regulator
MREMMSLQGSLSIERMCELTRVSRASFYRSFREKHAVEEEMEVRSAIQQIAVEHRRRYGYRRIAADSALGIGKSSLTFAAEGGNEDSCLTGATGNSLSSFAVSITNMISHDEVFTNGSTEAKETARCENRAFQERKGGFGASIIDGHTQTIDSERQE